MRFRESNAHSTSQLWHIYRFIDEFNLLAAWMKWTAFINDAYGWFRTKNSPHHHVRWIFYMKSITLTSVVVYNCICIGGVTATEVSNSLQLMCTCVYNQWVEQLVSAFYRSNQFIDYSVSRWIDYLDWKLFPGLSVISLLYANNISVILCLFLFEKVRFVSSSF